MMPPDSRYSQMNFAFRSPFSSRLLSRILLQLRNGGGGLFVDKTAPPRFGFGEAGGVACQRSAAKLNDNSGPFPERPAANR